MINDLQSAANVVATSQVQPEPATQRQGFSCGFYRARRGVHSTNYWPGSWREWQDSYHDQGYISQYASDAYRADLKCCSSKI